MQNPPAPKQKLLRCRGIFCVHKKSCLRPVGAAGSLFVYCWLSMAVSQASAWA